MFSWLNGKRKQRQEVPQETPRRDFNDTIAHDLLQSIRNEYGLDYSKQEYITFRKLERFAIKNGIETFEDLQKRYNDDPVFRERLLNMLTVGETYFFRERSQMELLASFVLNDGVRNVLCAPSSSGEEAYGIAITIYERSGSGVPDFRITGIDINSDVIAAAKRGCYLKRSVSMVPPQILEKYFHHNEDEFCVLDALKRHTHFLRMNVFEVRPASLGTFEAIFCRNMLIYFQDEQKRNAIANLRGLLTHRGKLFLGHADVAFVPEGFEKIDTPTGSYYEKI